MENKFNDIPNELPAASNPCLPALKEGVRNHLRVTTSMVKYSSLKEYLKSEEFKAEASKGGWSAGLSFPISGVPVGGNAASARDDRAEFLRKLETFSESQLFEAVAVAIEKSEPNTQLTRDYFKCVSDVFGEGFSHLSERLGTRVYITIRFMPISVTDEMPVLKEDPTVHNATDVSGPRKDQRLDFATIISALPTNPKEAVAVELRTTKGDYLAEWTPPPPPGPIIIVPPKERKSFLILGVRHRDGTVGKYFGFKGEDLDVILGRKDWHNSLIDVSTEVSGPTRRARVWRSRNGTAGTAHGRYEQGFKQGNWSEGGRIYVQTSSN